MLKYTLKARRSRPVWGLLRLGQLEETQTKMVVENIHKEGRKSIHKEGRFLRLRGETMVTWL